MQGRNLDQPRCQAPGLRAINRIQSHGARDMKASIGSCLCVCVALLLASCHARTGETTGQPAQPSSSTDSSAPHADAPDASATHEAARAAAVAPECKEPAMRSSAACDPAA